MFEFKKWLEMSYAENDIPKYFFLCPYFKPQDLISGVLRGVEGLTADHRTALSFFKDCFYIMDGQTTEKMNNLSRVLYDNPHYMTSNNLSAYFRIGKGAENVYGGGKNTALYSLCDRISDGISEQIGFKIYSGNLVPLVYGAKDLVDLSKIVWNEVIQQIKKESPEKLGIFYEKWNNQQALGKFIGEIIASSSKIFQHEKEWRVKDQWGRDGGKNIKLPTLKIPKGSHIWILANQQQEVERNGLLNQYQITYFPSEYQLTSEAKNIFSGDVSWEALNQMAKKSQEDIKTGFAPKTPVAPVASPKSAPKKGFFSRLFFK
jgi:hypothetical protein